MGYESRATWYINTSTGNDANNGNTSGTALLTGAELSRRMSGLIINQRVDIYWTGDQAAGDYVSIQCTRLAAGTIFFHGVPTTQYTSAGGFTTVVNLNRTTPTMGRVADSALSDTWANLGYIGTSRIRTTGGSNTGAKAWAIKDENGTTAKSARTSAWFTHDPTVVPMGTGFALVDVATSDAFIIELLPKIYRFAIVLVEPDDLATQTNGVGLSIDAVDFQNKIITCLSIGVVFSGCAGIALGGPMSGEIILLGCHVPANAVLSGFYGTPMLVIMHGCACMGNTTAQMGSSLWIDNNTVMQGGYLRARLNGMIRIGSLACFDSSTDAIRCEMDAQIRNDLQLGVPTTLLWGSGATAYGIRCAGRMSYSVKPTVSGTTNDTIIGGVATAYADIPSVNLANGAQLVVYV